MEENDGFAKLLEKFLNNNIFIGFALYNYKNILAIRPYSFTVWNPINTGAFSQIHTI